MLTGARLPLMRSLLCTSCKTMHYNQRNAIQRVGRGDYLSHLAGTLQHGETDRDIADDNARSTLPVLPC